MIRCSSLVDIQETNPLLNYEHYEIYWILKGDVCGKMQPYHMYIYIFFVRSGFYKYSILIKAHKIFSI